MDIPVKESEALKDVKTKILNDNLEKIKKLTGGKIHFSKRNDFVCAELRIYTTYGQELHGKIDHLTKFNCTVRIIPTELKEQKKSGVLIIVRNAKE